MSEHTPGPWRVRGPNPPPNYPAAYYVGTDGGHLVAWVPTKPWLTEMTRRCSADAQLVAAAPALLEAARAALRWQLNGRKANMPRHIADLLAAAVAKAEDNNH